MKTITPGTLHSLPPCAATIGFFDGVHRGHRFLLEQVKEEAVGKGLCPSVITFPTHPRQVLQPDFHPQLLSTPAEKLHLLEEAGIAKKKEVPTYVTQTFAQAFQPKKQSFSLGSFGKPNKNEKSMDLSKYAVGKKVTHPKFGEGVIVNTDALEGAKCIAIDFKNFGQKNLSVEYAPITVID